MADVTYNTLTHKYARYMQYYRIVFLDNLREFLCILIFHGLG